MSRIGILGGTFDPVHNAHIAMARTALSVYSLDKVVFMPAGLPYLKTGSRLVSMPVHRENMTRLAVEGQPGFEYSDLECRKQGNTYTAETLTELKALWPEEELYFIMGADSLTSLRQWKEPERILSQAVIIAACRSDAVDRQTLSAEAAALMRDYGGDIRIMDWTGMDLSSTKLRESIRRGCRALPLPERVLDYILERGLYLDRPDLRQIDARLRTELNDYRYRHTLGVADTARRLAAHYGEDPQRAYLAGLLHDCGKPYAGALEHAGLGAELAEAYYGVADPGILSAIRWHTVGRPAMTLLEKIIFIADMIEPSRDRIADLDRLRRDAFLDPDLAVLECLEATRSYLAEKGTVIDAYSESVYNYCKEAVYGKN